MKYAETVLDLVGNTPLVKLNSVTEGIQATVLVKIEYLNPGGSLEGPHRAAHHRRRRARGQAEAGRHDRRADQRQHRHRPRPRRPAARLPLRLRLPRQGQRRQDQHPAAPTAPRSSCARPRRAREPRLLLLGERPAGARDPGRVQARPVLEPERAAQPLRDHRSRDLARHRRPRSRTSWRASAPAAPSRASASTSRRSRAAACGSSAPTPRAPSTRAAPDGRTWSRASARTSGRPPTTRRSSTRSSPSSDAESFELHPPPRPRGGAAGRRLERARRRIRPQGRARRSAPTTSW